MDFENDPAADFLNREREFLGEIINEGEELAATIPVDIMSSDDFELINSDIQQADSNNADGLVDDLAGMSFNWNETIKTEEVPDKIRKWREEQIARLEQKDQQEQEAKEALRLSAEKEMADWSLKYKETMEKTKALNRNAEIEFDNADVASGVEAKNMWESITNLCDFSSKGPKNAKDQSRMRSIFLQMKSSPIASNAN